MEHSDQIENRFKSAALELCRRWECFNFEQKNPGKILPGWEAETVYGNHPIEGLKRRIETTGGEAASDFLRSQPLSDIIVELSAQNRLDLAMEALCIRPAWSDLLSAEDRATATQRLMDAVSFASNEVPASGADLDSAISWLDERLRYIEEDTSGNDSCESLAENARDLEETGHFRTSFAKRRHYRNCPTCAKQWPRLDSIVSERDKLYFDSCRKILAILTKCLNLSEERVALLGPSEAHPPNWDIQEALAWRAIVCAEYASERLPSPEQYRKGLIAGDPDFKEFVASLTTDDVLALHFAHQSRLVVYNLQYRAFDDSSPMVLTTDGDLSSVPGILEVLPSKDLREWTKLMTGRDLQGIEEEAIVDGLNLFVLLHEAAELQARNPDVLPMSPMPVTQTSHDQYERIQSGFGVLGDAIDSVRAGQLPIIDTMQQMLRRIDAPSRHRAEESLKEVLKEATYLRLCPSARNAAITAEYGWLDENFPAPCMIVFGLATAFECEVKESILKPFCHFLTEAGAKNYPEPEGPSPGIPPKAGMPIRPGQWQGQSEFPVLLRRGMINPRLTLGNIERLFSRPLSSMIRFFSESERDLDRLAKLLPDIREWRNLAHEFKPHLREEAEEIRRRWLGLDDPDSNIFTTLKPNNVKFR